MHLRRIRVRCAPHLVERDALVRQPERDRAGIGAEGRADDGVLGFGRHDGVGVIDHKIDGTGAARERCLNSLDKDASVSRAFMVSGSRKKRASFLDASRICGNIGAGFVTMMRHTAASSPFVVARLYFETVHSDCTRTG